MDGAERRPWSMEVNVKVKGVQRGASTVRGGDRWRSWYRAREELRRASERAATYGDHIPHWNKMAVLIVGHSGHYLSLGSFGHLASEVACFVHNLISARRRHDNGAVVTNERRGGISIIIAMVPLDTLCCSV